MKNEDLSSELKDENEKSDKSSLVIENDEKNRSSLFIENEEKNKSSKKTRTIIIISIIAVSLLILIAAGMFIWFKYFNTKELILEEIYVPEPLEENNKYEYTELSNGLRVLFINPIDQSISEGLQTKIVLTLGVGSASDPSEFSGMANLLGFLNWNEGSNNYKGNYIETVLNKYNGKGDFYYDFFTSNYYFNLDNKGADVLLKILADIIKNPPISDDDETIIRNIEEINYINSLMSVGSDMNNYNLIKSIGVEESKVFSDGYKLFENNINLKKLRKEVSDFHGKYYSSNLMTLVIINSNYKKLEEIIKNDFQSIPNKNTPRPFYEEKIKTKFPFRKNHLGSIFYLNSQKTEANVNLNFVIKSHLNLNTLKPDELFIKFLQYEGEGSIQSELYKNNIMKSFHSYNKYFKDSENTVLSINFGINEDKPESLLDLLKYFFSFVEFLKKYKDIDSIYKKMQNFSKYDFLLNLDSNELKFSPFKPPEDLSPEFALFGTNLLDPNPQYVLTGENVLYDFDEKIWKEFLDSLSIENLIAVYESSNFKVEKIGNTLENNEKKNPKEIEIDEKNKEIDQKESIKINKSQQHDDKKNGQENEKKIGNQSNKERDLIRRILENSEEEEEYEKEREDDLTYIENFEDINEDPKNIILEKMTDFDDSIYKKKSKFSENFIKNFKKNLIKFEFQILDKIDLKINDKMQFSDKCEFDYGKSESERLLKKKENSNKEDDVKTINMKYILDFTFNFEPLTEEDKKIYKKFQKFKKCVNKDFAVDKTTGAFTSIKEESNFSLYLKTYRIFYQPKINFFIEIENKYFINEITENSYRDRVKYQLMVKILCNYFENNLKEKFLEDFISFGLKFSCFLNENTHFVFSLETHKNKNESENYIKLFQEMKDPKNIDERKLDFIKDKVIGEYSNFIYFGAINVAFYFLDSLIDKNQADIHEEYFDKFQIIVNEIKIEEIANLAEKALQFCFMKIFIVGSIKENNALELGEKLKNIFEYKKDEIKVDRLSIIDKMIQIPEIGTSVFRYQNPLNQGKNVYLTYFYIGVLDMRKYFYLKVIIFMFWIYANHYLRSNLRLGENVEFTYKDYHFRSGVTFQIEGNFIPNIIEETIDYTIQQAIEDINKKSDEELKEVFIDTINKERTVGTKLEKISINYFKIFNRWKVYNDDKSTFKECIETFDGNALRNYAKEIFLNKESQRRYIIEVFQNLTKTSEEFVLEKSKTLLNEEYILRDLDDDEFNDDVY